jgi:RNase P/RNase MRP subunit p29
MHGVLLRPPGRTVTSSGAMPIGSAPPSTAAPLKNIEELMAEADPMKTGAVRMVDRSQTTPNSVAPAPTVSIPNGPTPASLKNAGLSPVPTPSVPKKAEPLPPGAVLPAQPVPSPGAAGSPSAKIGVSNPTLIPPPFPAFRPAVSSALYPLSEAKSTEPRILSSGSKAPETQRINAEPTGPSAAPTVKAGLTAAPTIRIGPKPVAVDSPFILKNPKAVELTRSSAEKPKAETHRVVPQPPPPMMPAGSVLRRKTKMADVARIVLPPRREDTQPLLPADSSAVVPPAFPVSAMTARASQPLGSSASETAKPMPVVTGIFPRIVAKPAETPSKTESFIDLPKPETASETVEKSVDAPAAEATPAVEEKPVTETKAETKTDTKPDTQPDDNSGPIAEAKPVVAEPTPATDAKPFIEAKDAPAPKSEGTIADVPAPEVARDEKAEGSEKPENAASPEPPKPAETPGPTTTPEAAAPAEPAPLFSGSVNLEPKVDPEAHKPKPTPAPSPAESPSLAPAVTPERREFHLANGEKVAGVVLSETPDAVYLEHGTLGVVTVPKAQIAKRLVEIILINGDRIVGDIMAETADTLYVRHASLGMLTVPRAQRSTRVVEAILKDGDRILGEVLTETDSFTVIRSATLGTVTVPHSKMQMLNRKIEQIELKALPPAAPELKDKAG